MRESSSLDQSIALAWDAFRAGFSESIDTLPPGREICLDVPATSGPTRSIDVLRSPDGDLVLAEVATDELDAGPLHFAPWQTAQLLASGWASPEPAVHDRAPTEFHVVTEGGVAGDLIADLVVETLRTVFGIPHPAFFAPAPDEDALHRTGGVGTSPDGDGPW